MVDLRHLIDKCNHPAIILQHEGVDGDAFTGAALYL